MKTVALCIFQDRPWEKVLLKALSYSLNQKYTVAIYDGYPPEGAFFDFLFIVGIRSIVKLGLDGPRLRKAANCLIDFGDDSNDPRRNLEDIYFYFYESGNKPFDHYQKLPKFILDSHLRAEQNDVLPTVFVDHFNDMGSYLPLVVDQLKRSPYKLQVFYQASTGIKINPSDKDFKEYIDDRDRNFKYLPFEEIAAYYRKTHIFLPTHQESQGTVGLEIGACGGLTLMKPGTYPKQVADLFIHGLYDENHPINWERAICCAIQNKEKYRQKVLSQFSLNFFKTALINHLENAR